MTNGKVAPRHIVRIYTTMQARPVIRLTYADADDAQKRYTMMVDQWRRPPAIDTLTGRELELPVVVCRDAAREFTLERDLVAALELALDTTEGSDVMPDRNPEQVERE